jgi:hypothetical protein
MDFRIAESDETGVTIVMVYVHDKIDPSDFISLALRQDSL